MLTRGIPPAFRDGVFLYTPSTVIISVPSLYQITQLRADGVHYLESAGTGPVALKVVPVKGAAFSGVTMDQIICAFLFPNTLLVNRTREIQTVSEASTRHLFQGFAATYSGVYIFPPMILSRDARSALLAALSHRNDQSKITIEMTRVELTNGDEDMYRYLGTRKKCRLRRSRRVVGGL